MIVQSTKICSSYFPFSVKEIFRIGVFVGQNVPPKVQFPIPVEVACDREKTDTAAIIRDVGIIYRFRLHVNARTRRGLLFNIIIYFLICSYCWKLIDILHIYIYTYIYIYIYKLTIPYTNLYNKVELCKTWIILEIHIYCIYILKDI